MLTLMEQTKKSGEPPPAPSSSLHTVPKTPQAEPAAAAPPPAKPEHHHHGHHHHHHHHGGGFVGWLKARMRLGKSETLREVIEEYIGDSEPDSEEDSSVTSHERILITNVLRMRDMTVVDVMIPRADIVAIDIDISHEDLLSMLAEKQFSRLPVYRGKLDDVLGTIHIKDIIACLARGSGINLADLVREVPIVSPAMHVFDLLLMMKQMRRHMALVVDEFGGIDGLVTIGDLIEAIVGQVEDEYDQGDTPQMSENPGDHSVLADGRLPLEEFEERYGDIFTEEEREDADTIGGVVASLAGRMPARGEIISHPSGMVFEIVDADPRRINRVRIRNIGLHGAAEEK
jgi:CBS domain containing-hemolysin-like protein